MSFSPLKRFWMHPYARTTAARSADPLPSGISVVVPVYNSEGTLGDLISRLEGVLSGLGCEFEAVLVNDGSRDGSWPVLVQLAKDHPWVTGLNLMRNYGQHNALLCGIRAARYDKIVTIDDDLQNPPEEIPKLLAKLDEGFDVVYGPPERESHGILRNAASKLIKMAMQTAMGVGTARNVSAFRAFRTQLRDAFEDYRAPYVCIDVLLSWGTAKFSAVPVRQDERTIGTSGYNLVKLIRHAINMMTGFSHAPLQLASFLGFAFMIFGMGILVYVLGRYFIFGAGVAGFTFLASAIAIFSGVQLLVLGIIGEYLARMHARMLERPTYSVRSTSAADLPEPEAVATEASE